MASDAMQATISLLPVTLSVVHVPRPRIPQLIAPILRELLRAHTFFNITCNEIELSIFADSSVLAHFAPVAQRDERRARSRSRSDQSTTPYPLALDPVEVSADAWHVLQIDSHSDRLDSSGARIHELSAPLAAAGISILYQSSYMSDFIFVKEQRLQEVMILLSDAGFDFYSPDPTRPLSMYWGAASPGESLESSIADMRKSETGVVMTRTHSSYTISRGSLSRARSSTSASLSSALGSPSPPADEGEPSTTPKDLSSSQEMAAHRPGPSRSPSYMPNDNDVAVLSPDLACIGLSDEHADTWITKIIKLVAYPDLIPGNETSLRPSSHPLLAKVSQTTTHAERPQPRQRRRQSNFSLESLSDSDSEDSDSLSNSDDEYFSQSSQLSTSTPSLGESAPSTSECPQCRRRTFSQSSSCACPEKLSSGEWSASPDKIDLSLTPSSSAVPPRPILPHLETATQRSVSARTSPVVPTFAQTLTAEPRSASAVPFFSFTRTSEGSSLTTSTALLAKLFPPHERHMVICSDELDRLEEGDEMDDEDTQGPLRCLQIDLRRFGLEKHGLVARFSCVLEEAGINHTYSSTFKTANLLVDKRYAHKAQALLRAC